MVVGGHTNEETTEILDLETLEWRAGPAPPVPMDHGQSLQYGDTFAIVGGIGELGFLDTIYLFEPEVIVHSLFLH